MKRGLGLLALGVTLAIGACSSSKSTTGAGVGGAAAANESSSGSSVATSSSSSSSSGPDGGVLGGTPIHWADAWVAGFYGTPAYQGVNRYDNTNTAGATGYHTTWRGDSGSTVFESVSDCSSFSDALLMRSYGWTPTATDIRPHADDYYWAIRGGEGFTEITNANDIQVGDVIALLYPPGSSDTGHVAWIDVAPTAFSGMPVEAGLSQLVVTVIDSTNGFHDGPTGPTTQADDRYLGPGAGDGGTGDGGAMCTSDVECVALYGANAICNTTQLLSESVCSYTGVGRGRMRLYVDATGTIQGHTWSPNDQSTYYARPSPLPTVGGAFTGEDIVVGRYSRSP